MSQFEHVEYLIKDFPLLQQMDNKLYPSGSCNMTALAAVMQFYGVKPNRNFGYNQLEDQLLALCDSERLSRHSPETIRELAERFGLNDRLIIVEGWREVGDIIYNDFVPHLKAKKPVILHGEFTQSGHIVCCDGVRLINGRVVQVHISDPFGEWYPEGYRINYGGDRNLGRYWLSYNAFSATALKDGILWCHLIEKK